MQKGFVYILESRKNGMYYIGASENPKRRLRQHNDDTVSATRKKGPWELRFFQEYASLREAKIIEYKLKKLKRRDYLEDIIKSGKIRMQISGCSAVG